MSFHTLFRAVLGACFFIALPVGAAVSLPTWHGEANTTSQVFLFDSAILTPGPNHASNPFGEATATVGKGAFGNGWESPGAPFGNPGHDGDGAWDIGGAGGMIQITVPIAPAGSPSEVGSLDVWIHLVAYQDLQKLPIVALDGAALSPIDSSIASTRPPSGRWYELTLSAEVAGFSADTITLTFTPPSTLQAPNGISVIDRVEIYTRFTAVPEPSAVLFVLMGGTTAAFRRRRS